jgi:ABC-type transporter Mla subunit MlaD
VRRIALIACTAVAALGLWAVGPASGGDGGPYYVRAVFDNANFLVEGEDVRIAGAKVGEVDSVGVSMPGETVSLQGGPRAVPGKAVVVLRIDDPAFQEFRRDASCITRPQSLLGEKFVECRSTRPRAPGTEPPPELTEVPEGQPGAGQRLLPLESNGHAVDLDIVQDIQRLPYAQRFRIILNELGASVAARGGDLRQIIERANPALRETNEVLGILARQRRTLARLAEESETVLAPLARRRASVSGFIDSANATNQAVAERRADLEAGLERLPAGLRELRLTMAELGRFSGAATPVVANLRTAAPDLSRAAAGLAPFSRAATRSLVTLGDAARRSQADIVGSDPIVKAVRDLADEAAPGAKSLRKLMRSLDSSGGFEELTRFVYLTTGAVNGFDSYGHFLRGLLRISNCVDYVTEPLTGCSAKFDEGEDATGARQSSPAQLKRFLRANSPAYSTRTTGALARFLTGGDRGP